MQWLGQLKSKHDELPPEFLYHKESDMYEFSPKTYMEGLKWRHLRDESGDICVISPEGVMYDFRFRYPSAKYELWMGDAPEPEMIAMSFAPGPNFRVSVGRVGGTSKFYNIESKRFIGKNIYKYILCKDKNGKASMFRRVDEPST